jgi:hypothetical protein
MGRLIAFILGGAALALYGPHLFLSGETLANYQKWWTDNLGEQWYSKIFTYGPGIFAGIALLLLAVRGKD